MQILSRLGRESQRKLRGLHREMLGKVRNWEEKGSQGGSTEPGRGGVGSPVPHLCAQHFRPVFWPGRAGLGASLSAVPPRVALPGLPYLAGSAGLWAGLEERGGGRPEEDARSWLRGRAARKAEGWGSWVGCPLPL